MLQALEIEDPVVANCLIDQMGIESILLIKVTSNTSDSIVIQAAKTIQLSFSVYTEMNCASLVYTLAYDDIQTIRCVWLFCGACLHRIAQRLGE